ncbi:MAG: CRISPR-associated endonuclease Cas1 [Desulfurococcales archaeon]|nr:CRISPR-associated endonuclease Cas1 [Desulfurococcales archaeon]
MILNVVRPGWELRLRQGALEARGRDGDRLRIPLAQVDAILIATRGAMVSSALLGEAARLGIPVYLVTASGDVVAVVEPGEAHRTADTQLAQASWRLDPARRLEASRWFVRLKVEARARMLRLEAKRLGDPELRDASYELEARARALVGAASSLEELRGAEAALGRAYWGLYAGHLLPRGLGFTGRRPRGGDPVNSSLDYLYAILRGYCHSALRIAGLNPYVGFMHSERSGRPSLTLDFMEVFRWRVEEALARLVARGFRPVVEEGLLDRESRAVLASEWARLSEARLPRSKRTLREAIVAAAWGLASSLRRGAAWEPELGV